MTLADARPGQRLVVEKITAGRGASRRLWDLGILPGAELTVIASHPFRGPILVKAGEASVAVGRGLASHVLVKKM